ncbi:hypothetical protein IC608_08550 [Devosia sp. PTR5]|uniref:Uncharacterized protein n=1 Tax=Devosia oryzisoli TaxID=2774138 RepID=A0A927IT79_9HYPH|nr:hypothetical protein [Devosia oryzisoli]MBD8065523.1 hypothetical protein [Devosia oryzisoli]
MPAQTLTPAMLETRARRLDDRIRTRNLWEFVAGGLVVAASIAIAALTLLSSPWNAPALTIAGGFILLGLGALVAMWQLRRRTSPPRIDGAAPTLGHYRAELVRQRDALRSVFRWYIAPFLPGFILIYGATLFDAGALWSVLLPALATLIFLSWVVYANHRAAACIDTEIADLDRTAQET